MRTPQPRILDWYRVDTWPRMRRLLLTGPAVLTLGGLVVAVSFLKHQRQDLRAAEALVGLVLVASGALLTTAGMHRILRDETYLAIRTDGVALWLAPGETVIVWDSLAHARWDAPRREIVLERKHAEAIAVAHRFARVTGPALAERIEHARRKAAMGLLR